MIARSQRRLPPGLPPDLFEQSIPQRFVHIAQRTPDHLALAGGDQSLTYGQLDAASGAVAAALSERLGEDRQVVATALDLDVFAVIAMLGVMRAGKVFMPLDSAGSSESVTAALRDARTALVITDESRLADAHERLGAGVAAVDYRELLVGSSDGDVQSDPGEDALLLYTSGSQGEPRGVAISHRSELHSVLNLARGMELGPGDHFFELFSLTFSAAILWSLAPLTSGAALWLYDLRRRGLAGLSGALAEANGTAVSLVPSVLREFVAIAPPEDLHNVRSVVVGGERFVPSDLERAQRAFPASCTFLQLLGSTEAIVVGWSLGDAQALPETDLPLHPFPDTGLEILDEAGRRAAADEVGELAVRSHYLSRGYWNRPELTEAAFRTASDGAQVFRTGDFGWIDEHQRLHFVGRRDGLVKVRGQRVELAAVETAVVALDGVLTAAVAAVESADGTVLTAYVVPAPTETKLEPAEVRAALGRALSSAAVPSSIFVVDELPTLPNGKLDRRAIAAAASERQTSGVGETDPTDDIELAVQRIWEEVLDHRPISLTDDFFSIGGNSLLAMRMLVAIEEQLSCALTPGALLEAPTINSLAKILRDPRSGTQHVRTMHAGGDRPPLFLAYPRGGSGIRYRWLAEALGDEFPIHMLEAPWWDGRSCEIRTVEQLATHHVAQIQRLQPAGPYLLGGHSFGGLLAYEIARQLAAAGHDIALVAISDTRVGADLHTDSDPRTWPMPAPTSIGHRIRRRLWLFWATQRFRAGKLAVMILTTRKRLRWRLDQRRFGSVPERRRAEYVATMAAAAGAAYGPLPYDGPLTLIRCAGSLGPPDLGWGKLARGGLELLDVPGNHEEILFPPLVEQLASKLSHAIRYATQASP